MPHHAMNPLHRRHGSPSLYDPHLDRLAHLWTAQDRTRVIGARAHARIQRHATLWHTIRHAVRAHDSRSTNQSPPPLAA